jgi:FkbM family methyltransferase
MEKLNYILKGSPIAKELLGYYVDNKTVILDCGACDGLDSIIYSKLLPDASIHAIEPRYDNYSEIIENLRTFDIKNVHAVQACLSDREEEVTFYNSYGQSNPNRLWNTGNKSSSILRPTGHLNEHRWCRFTEEKIKTVRFDSLGIPKIDFMHLDVQGAEIKVLDGMGAVLNTVGMIWLEVASIELYEGQPLVTDIDTYLSIRGFRKMKDTCRKYGDQLWVR